MNIETSGTGALIIILVMALVTLVTRWAGVYIMSLVPIGGRIKLFIQAMSGSVLVAILTPMAVTGDNGARMALLTTAVMMLLLKKPLPAISCGIIVAAFIRSF
jgi:uncharacterized membrane protein